MVRPGRRPDQPERQRAAQRCAGMVGLAIGCGRCRPNERVSWAVDIQANPKEPTA